MESFSAQYPTPESMLQEAKTCFTAATKKLQSLMALEASQRNTLVHPQEYMDKLQRLLVQTSMQTVKLTLLKGQAAKSEVP